MVELTMYLAKHFPCPVGESNPDQTGLRLSKASISWQLDRLVRREIGPAVTRTGRRHAMEPSSRWSKRSLSLEPEPTTFKEES